MVRLHEIYIILKPRGIPAVHTKFGRTGLHPDLVSGFITAISHFARQLRPGEQKDINLIKREDFVIIIEDGNKVFGALIADFDDKNAREILKQVINTFEDEFDKNLDDLGVNTLIFEKFIDVIHRKFSELVINPYYIPQIIQTVQNPPVDPLIKRVLPLVDGQKNLNEIAELLDTPIEGICQIIAQLENRGFIELKINIEDSDTFGVNDKATEVFSRETKSHKRILELFGNEGIDVLYSLDGKKDLKNIIDELGIPFNQLIKIIQYLLKEDIISWIELYPIMRQFSSEKILSIISDKKEQSLAFTLQNICDGTYSLSSISRKIDLPKGEIKRFLKKFGNDIRWIEKKV
ncbi:MAG TPA: hypothetical protein VMV49_16080 [Candidatus Deferrimicrobium sp.]|nr:hypothetical protein [Candidatus Deferrimicrobium sp.]